ncbi:hypothetical protein A2U01_0099572, partial [Trifolium medium]|nr:hypothetical protein [Trifolium medium]
MHNAAATCFPNDGNRDKSVGLPPNSVTTGGGFCPRIVLGFLFRCRGGGGGSSSSS